MMFSDSFGTKNINDSTTIIFILCCTYVQTTTHVQFSMYLSSEVRVPNTAVGIAPSIGGQGTKRQKFTLTFTSADN